MQVVVEEDASAEVTLNCTEESTLTLGMMTLPYNETCESRWWGQVSKWYCGLTPQVDVLLNEEVHQLTKAYMDRPSTRTAQKAH